MQFYFGLFFQLNFAAQNMTMAASSSFYCSTSGTFFSDKEAYLEHMRSDFHRYNLKRKVTSSQQERMHQQV
jgi:hypothetical protein